MDMLSQRITKCGRIDSTNPSAQTLELTTLQEEFDLSHRLEQHISHFTDWSQANKSYKYS